MNYNYGNFMQKRPYNSTVPLKETYSFPEEHRRYSVYPSRSTKKLDPRRYQRNIHQNQAEDTAKVAYSSADVKDRKYINATDTLAENVMDYSKDFIKNRTIQDFSRIKHRVDLSLINSDVSDISNTGSYRYDLGQITSKSNTNKLSEFDATISVSSSFFKISRDGVPANVDVSELYINISLPIKYGGCFAYNYRMVPDANLDPSATHYVYRACFPKLELLSQTAYNDVVLSIYDQAGKIVFNNPFITGDATTVGPNTNVEIENHGLTTGFRVYNSYMDRALPLTVVDPDNFTIPTVLPVSGDVDFVVLEYNFTYGLEIETIKQDDLTFARKV